MVVPVRAINAGHPAFLCVQSKAVAYRVWLFLDRLGLVVWWVTSGVRGTWAECSLAKHRVAIGTSAISRYAIGNLKVLPPLDEYA